MRCAACCPIDALCAMPAELAKLCGPSYAMAFSPASGRTIPADVTAAPAIALRRFQSDLGGLLIEQVALILSSIRVLAEDIDSALGRFCIATWGKEKGRRLLFAKVATLDEVRSSLKVRSKDKKPSYFYILKPETLSGDYVANRRASCKIEGC